MLTLPPHPHPYQKIKGASPALPFFFMIVCIDHKNVLMKLWLLHVYSDLGIKELPQLNSFLFLRPVYCKSF